MSATPSKPSIVLVHGAFADGSGWSKVITLLEKDGYAVTAVQNNMTTAEEDAATTRRVIDAQPGPVVLVGHSYGGSVITSAAVGAANVKALVYVCAFAPDAGENFFTLITPFPTPLGGALRPDAAGYAFIDRAQFHAVFCGDVTDEEARVMAATQRPAHVKLFEHIFGEPAWKTIPSWFIVGQKDQVIHPDLERKFAARMKATTRELDSSHVPFVSRPGDVVKVVIEAAESIGATAGTSA
jgi:pimeloyl-ACP methyl ester carboxylesterase